MELAVMINLYEKKKTKIQTYEKTFMKYKRF